MNRGDVETEAGLVLFAGRSGSSKSTLLAALAPGDRRLHSLSRREAGAHEIIYEILPGSAGSGRRLGAPDHQSDHDSQW